MTPRLVQRAGLPITLTLRGGRLVDPAQGIDAVVDIAISSGVISAIGDDVNAEGGEVLDLDGAAVLPAFIDPHVHLRTPGQEYKEDLATGTAAAAAGGFCVVLAMPNTTPPVDQASVLEALFERGHDECVIPTGFLAAVTLGLAGAELTEMYELHARGACGFTDDGRPVEHAGLLRRAFQYAAPLGVPLALHEQELSLSPDAQMREGAVSARLGLAGYPSIAESVMVARDLRIARYEQARVHLQHLSCRESVEELAWARSVGCDVTAEVTPHHLLLTDEAVASLDANMKMNPPLGTSDDRTALIEAFRDGVICCLATDHAPHAPDEKSQPFEAAPNGVIGLETAFAAVYTSLVRPGRVGLDRLVSAMTTAPAAAFGLQPPRIAVGERANVGVWRLDEEFVVDPDRFVSRSTNSCFAGQRFSGVCQVTIADGRVAHRRVAAAR